jgi:pyrroline-5-carboxylate reductase
MADRRIAFIGAGNMAQALVGGLLARGIDAATLAAADPDDGQRHRMGALGVATHADNAHAVTGADVVVLAVKPQAMQAAVRELAPALRGGQLLVSIAAGIPIAAIEAWSARNVPIVRCMPNTPALYGLGITALVPNAHVSAPQLASAQAILEAAGETVLLDDESLLDAVTAVSGSGPAYVFYLLEAMIDAGRELGLPAHVAHRLATRTALGASTMATRSNTAPAELRRNVTSPGGTTERAIGALDAGGVRELLKQAIREAAIRSRELGQEFGERKPK